VSYVSTSSIPGGVSSEITITGRNFGAGPGTGLFALSYSNGTWDTPCAPAMWVDSTRLRCKTHAATPLYSIGLHFRVFVSGMVTQTTHKFSVLSQFPFFFSLRHAS